MKQVPFEPLDPGLYREIVRRALAEDLGWGDVTTEATVPAELRARGIILAKSPCVIAGVEVAAEAFRQLDPAVVFTVRHGDGIALRPGRRDRRGPRHGRVDADRGTDGPQPDAAHVGHRHDDAAIRRRRGRTHHHPRHAQDHADAARSREICGPRRRRHQSPQPAWTTAS